MRWILAFSISLIIFSCQNNASQSASGAEEIPLSADAPRIRIKVNGINEGTASMIGMLGDQQYRADTATIGKDGYFLFTNEKPYQEGLYFFLMPNESIVQVLVDSDQDFTITADKGDLINSAVIEGSKENELFYTVLKYEEVKNPEFSQVIERMKAQPEGSPAFEELKKQRDALTKERNDFLDKIFNDNPDALITKFKKAGQNPEIRNILLPDGTPDKKRQVYWFRKDFWNMVDFSDPRLLYTPVIGNKLNRYITELTVQHPDSIIASAKEISDMVLEYPEYYKYIVNWITLKYEPGKSTLMDAEAVFVNMIQNYFTYERAFWTDSAQVYAMQLRAFEMSKSLVGQKAPNVKVPGLDGVEKELYAMKQPYLIVYMFTPTCEHCMKETPKLVEFLKQPANREFGVYAIAIDTDDAEWRQYVKEKNMGNFVNVFDPTNKSIYATYYVDNTPELYVLNPERKIIGKNLKTDQIMIVVNRDKEERGK